MSQFQPQPEVGVEASSLLPSVSSTQSSSLAPEASSQTSSISSASQPFNSSNRSGAIISKIEDTLESIFDALQSGDKELSIPLRTRRSARRSQPQSQSNSQDVDASTSTANTSRTSRAVVTFPGKTAQEAEKFSMYCRFEIWPSHF